MEQNQSAQIEAIQLSSMNDFDASSPKTIF
jgi:hypothetical protein